MNSTKKERDPTTARTVQEVHFTSGTPLVPIHQRLSFGVVRHPCARILGERAAADVRPHAAREEQQGDTYYKHLHHFEAPCRTHNVHVPEMFPCAQVTFRSDCSSKGDCSLIHCLCRAPLHAARIDGRLITVRSLALLQTGATVQLSARSSRRPVQEAKATYSTGILMVQTVPCSELTTTLSRTCSTSRRTSARPCHLLSALARKPVPSSPMVMVAMSALPSARPTDTMIEPLSPPG